MAKKKEAAPKRERSIYVHVVDHSVDLADTFPTVRAAKKALKDMKPGRYEIIENHGTYVVESVESKTVRAL